MYFAKLIYYDFIAERIEYFIYFNYYGFYVS